MMFIVEAIIAYGIYILQQTFQISNVTLGSKDKVTFTLYLPTLITQFLSYVLMAGVLVYQID